MTFSVMYCCQVVGHADPVVVTVKIGSIVLEDDVTVVAIDTIVSSDLKIAVDCVRG